MEDWKEIDGKCPECGEQTLLEAPWWDDSPENGGSCIGRKVKCTSCGYYESF